MAGDFDDCQKPSTWMKNQHVLEPFQTLPVCGEKLIHNNYSWNCLPLKKKKVLILSCCLQACVSPLVPFTVWKVSFSTEDGCGIWVRMGTLSLRFAVLGWLTAGVRMSRRDKNKCGQASWWDYWCSLRVLNWTCQTWGKWGEKMQFRAWNPIPPAPSLPFKADSHSITPTSCLYLYCHLAAE